MKITLFNVILVGVCGIAVAQVPSDHPDTLKATVATLIQAEKSLSSDRSAELQRLIYAAGPDGTVRIPAGCYEIGQIIYVTNGRRIIGAGRDQTILYRSSDKSRNHAGGIFKFAEPKTKGGLPTRISGISFVGVRDATGEDKDWDFGIVLNDSRDFRVDNCYFEGFGLAGIKVVGKSRGVVDHCFFVDNFKKSINTIGYGVVVYGAEEWPEDPQMGTAEATVVEDCVFIGNRHAISSNAGAHYVFRHNLVQRNVVASAIDAHGPGFGSSRGTRCVEVYENVIDEPAHKWCGIGIRGGEGVIFKNTIKDYRNPIYLFLEFDQPPNAKLDYPVKDQVQNLWIWDNQITNGPVEPLIEEKALELIRKDRDFFTTPKPGYKALDYPHPLVQRDPAR